MNQIDATTYGEEPQADPARRIQVEIGDRLQQEFHPQVKTLHWDNECNFSCRLIDDLSGVTTRVGNVVRYTRPDLQARFYMQSGDEDGQFEMDFRLLTPPASPVLTCSIRSKGLSFYRQEALDALRPAAVVGSYAVYATTLRHNRVGGKAYRTGKVFHLYRPHATDAIGQRVWCDLAIDEIAQTLTITIPSAFLASATYPITVDPTFGYTSVGATAQFITHNYYSGFGGAYAPASSGTLVSVSIYTAAAGVPLTLGVYTDASTLPDSLVAVSAGGNSVLTGWTTLALSGPVTATVPYWLAEANGTTPLEIRYDAVSAGSGYWEYKARTYIAGDLPATFGTPDGGFNDIKISVYATYAAPEGFSRFSKSGAGRPRPFAPGLAR